MVTAERKMSGRVQCKGSLYVNSGRDAVNLIGRHTTIGPGLHGQDRGLPTVPR